MKNTALTLMSATLLLLLSGCAAIFQPKTTTPIEFQLFGNQANPQHIYILLPGIRDRISSFEKHGFIETAKPWLTKHPDTALITVDAHWGYYRERIIEQRLQQDILDKFPEAKLSFVGISLGGFGSLIMTMANQDRVQNLILLAPFLGEDDYAYLERLKNQGIVSLPDDEDLTQSLNRAWAFLLDSERRIPIRLGYGRSDEFAPYYDFLISKKPPMLRIESIDGDHDWETWRKLWMTALGQIN